MQAQQAKLIAFLISIVWEKTARAAYSVCHVAAGSSKAPLWHVLTV